MRFQGWLASLEHERILRARLARARSKEWVVYAKPPLGGPEQVLCCLSRYTHRVAITNQWLVKLKRGQVTFLWKDYARRHRQRRMTLAAAEFICRFLLQVLPKGLARIRLYGLLANRSAKLERTREVLGASAPAATEGADSRPPLEAPVLRCQSCSSRHMPQRAIWLARRLPRHLPDANRGIDS